METAAVVVENVSEVVLANAPVITSQPVNVSAAKLEWVILSAEATGADVHRWQYRTATGSWNNMMNTWEGYKTNTVRFQMTDKKFGYFYRCAITGGGVTVYTDEVSITDKDEVPLEFITQPAADVAAARFEWVTLSVTANGVDTYRWQYKTATGDWTNMKSTWEGYNTDTLRFQMTTSRFGYTFRCAITGNDTTVYSDEVTITNKADIKLAILTQPVGYEADKLEVVTLSVAAVGVDSYLWQYKTPNADWANMTSTWEGYNTDTVSFKITASKFNYVYRCKITGNGDTVYTDEVMFTRTGAPVITEQPVGCEVTVGAEATLSVVAENAETYLWQYKSEGGAWTNMTADYAGYDTATVTIVMNDEAFDCVYRCIVTGNDMSVYSDEASFTKGQPLTLLVEEVLYTIDYDNSTLTVTSYSGSASSVVIPETLPGWESYPVTIVGVEAFMGNTTLVSIDLPDTIEVIADRAFMNCTSLRSMN